MNIHTIRLTIIIAFSIQAGLAANAGLTCTTDNVIEEFEKSMMSCMIRGVDTKLMIKIIENIKHPEKMMNLDFVCGYQNDMAKIMTCMVQKYSQCLPSELKKSLQPLFPNEEQWRHIIRFACDERKVLTNQCMTPEASQKFMKCYKNKLVGINDLTSLNSAKAFDQVYCHVRQSFDECITMHSGSCSTEYIEVLDKLIGIIKEDVQCDTAGNNMISGPNGVLKFKSMRDTHN